MTPHAANRWAKAELSLLQANRMSPEELPEPTIHAAYYAMLHAATAVLLDRTGSAPKTHSSTIGQFSQLVRDDDLGKSLAREFNLAERVRLTADYNDRIRPTVEEAAELRKTAIEFVAYCRSLLKLP
jgi:uncharacterized protein (UPF0332 family)